MKQIARRIITILFIIIFFFPIRILFADNIKGEYRCTGTPCLPESCYPCVAWAVLADDERYYLHKHGIDPSGCMLDISWNGYRPKEGDIVTAVGEINDYIDIYGKPFHSIQVEYLLPGICPVEIIYGTDSYETELLRSLRDNVLSKSQQGRELIKLYYQWSPTIVRAIEADEEFKQDIMNIIGEILLMVSESVE